MDKNSTRPYDFYSETASQAEMPRPIRSLNADVQMTQPETRSNRNATSGDYAKEEPERSVKRDRPSLKP